MKNRKPPSKPSNNEIDILDFKPLSVGLGFHKKKEMEPSQMVRKLPLKPISSINQTPVKSEQVKLFPAGLGSSSATTMIPPRASREANLPASISKIAAAFDATATMERTLIFPGQLKRSAAWLFDVIFILASVTILAFMIQFLSGQSEAQVLSYSEDVMINLYLPIFVFTYLFYFTLTERIFAQSLGKSSLKLIVKSTNFKSNLTLFQAFLRSALTLMNIICCGFITYYDIHNKIAQTVVVEEE